MLQCWIFYYYGSNCLLQAEYGLVSGITVQIIVLYAFSFSEINKKLVVSVHKAAQVIALTCFTEDAILIYCNNLKIKAFIKVKRESSRRE